CLLGVARLVGLDDGLELDAVHPALGVDLVDRLLDPGAHHRAVEARLAAHREDGAGLVGRRILGRLALRVRGGAADRAGREQGGDAQRELALGWIHACLLEWKSGFGSRDPAAGMAPGWNFFAL